MESENKPNNNIPKKEEEKQSIAKVKKKKKKKKKRCFVCNKKLGLIPFSCRCNTTIKFCSIHRYPDSHNCQFDWKKEGREQLEKNNPKVDFDKFGGNKIN